MDDLISFELPAFPTLTLGPGDPLDIAVEKIIDVDIDVDIDKDIVTDYDLDGFTADAAADAEAVVPSDLVAAWGAYTEAASETFATVGYVASSAYSESVVALVDDDDNGGGNGNGDVPGPGGEGS